MFILFGTTGRTTNVSGAEILRNSCPNCSSDLHLKELKQWFTLFFIPIFPFNTVDSFYKCDSCGSSYNQNIKQLLNEEKQVKDDARLEASKLFAVTTVACLTHMAIVDGDLAMKEGELIDKAKFHFSSFSSEVENIAIQIKSAKSPDEIVYPLLKECSEKLTSQNVMKVIDLSAKMLFADGKIHKKEEELMKDYLLICGIPKSMYYKIIMKDSQDTGSSNNEYLLA